ncbi:IclR family transcriptional regulator C-terminal domain-containing protein [Albimonas sp. CAU 1670]|uniref:IclR family transcriptional regulator n=1 Tax=Albimonas sp. CAU 1670 TaxID=3032599 RepID=UPI0023DAF31E|nr:IclR family transcriptional regulator C-terminal domain-containing protein [Albimonas sp. CAU 1670]MDF2234382.1 IclR family transcriptional regulator C-terminal domain-containing protein [Albimonas sp. CAU 1670]
MSPKDTNGRAGQVRAITRAVSVMRALSESADGLTLSETAAQSGLAASTAHRILTTLESERFVRFETASGCWHVGVAAFTVGAAFARTRDVIVLAKPYMRRLMETTGETANIFLESGGEIVCMGQVESRHAMRALTRVGGRTKMHWSAAGKAILAQMRPERARRVLEEQGMPRATARTLTEPAALAAELEKIRTEGVAVDDEEHADGLRCVGSAVLSENGTAAAAISVSGPRSRITDERLDQLRDAVGRIVSEVTREYGGRPAGS